MEICDWLFRFAVEMLVGNPCVFHSSLIPQLLSLEGDKGGRSVAKKYDCVYVDIADERELMDIDTLSNSKHTVTL